MSEHTTDGDSTDALIRGLVDHLSESGETAAPMPTTDADEVIRTQLTENTGRHLLDSGMYGRHWEENQENPPWDDPEYSVEGDGYVTHNLYDHLSRVFGRDRTAVELEVALYAFGRSEERKRQAWLRTEEDFAEMFLRGEFHRPGLAELDLPDPVIETVLGLQGGDYETETPFTANTYNDGMHTLSQVIQTVSFGGPYAEYHMVQVHGGADVRGGYTAPRVYKATYDVPVPSEYEFFCERCDWIDYESVVGRGDDYDLLFVTDNTREAFHTALSDAGWVGEDDGDHPAIETAADADHIDGAIFHRCEESEEDLPSDYVGHVQVR
jgi:hypothetical protein